MESTYYVTTTDTTSLDAGVIFGLLATYFIFIIALYVVFSIFMAKIFKKAGEDGWKAWVPIYNSWVFLEMGGQKGFWAILALVPFVNIVSVVFMAIAAYQIGLKLQKEGWFVLLYIFASPVWLIWLAVDGSKWEGVPAAASTAPPATPAAM